MLWKPVWFPHQTRPLGPLICWVVCVLGDTCLLPQSSLLPSPHFPALSFSATATAGSAAFILRQPKRHIHIMWHQVILNMQDEYTSDICVCVCVCAHILQEHAAHEYRWYDHLRTEHINIQHVCVFDCTHKCVRMSHIQIKMQFAIFPGQVASPLALLT